MYAITFGFADLIMVSEDSSAQPQATEKEGLLAAIEATKILLALAGGAIAFILQPMVGPDAPKPIPYGMLSIFALVFLAVSVASGLFVVWGAAVMLGHKDYDLESRYIKYPGLINVFTFFGGLLFLTLVIAGKIIDHMSL